MRDNLLLHRNGRELEVTVELPGNVSDIEFRFISGLNRTISKYTDVSKYDPEYEKKIADLKEDSAKIKREMFFPAVDIAIEPGMEAVAVFNTIESGKYCVNSMYYRKKRPLTKEITIPGSMLEHWENTIYVEAERIPDMESFYICTRLPVIPYSTRRFTRRFKLLTDSWCGTVEVYGLKDDGAKIIASASIDETIRTGIKDFKGELFSAERLLESLKGTVGYILRSQNKNPLSYVYGGLYTLYDLDSKFYRMPHWIWSWGPSVNVLLKAADIKPVSEEFTSESLREAARKLGDAILRFQINNDGHPADGLITAEWTPGLFDARVPENYGNVEDIDISDSNFNVGWGLVPLYEATGDRRYLEASKRVADTTGRVIQEFKLAPQHYLPDAGIWSDHTLNEAGFGVEGLSEVYRITGEERYLKITERYTDQFLEKVVREDGLWNCMWYRSKGEPGPCTFDTRGHGWAMEGLLAAHRASPSGKYLEYAVKMAEHLLKWQNPSGSWYFTFNDDTSGIGEKATTLWSMLFYRLYNETGEKKYLEAARKALAWCIEKQYTGPDPEAYGGIVSCNKASGIVYRRWFRCACSYASAFFGLAVIEELKLGGNL